MIVNSRKSRSTISDLLDQWSDWVYHENRGQLRQLGVKSWLGELVRNNNTQNNNYHEQVPLMDVTEHEEKMALVDGAVKSLPSLQRQTIVLEYLVRYKDRPEVRRQWLSSTGRTNSAHRKMLSSVKDILWLIVKVDFDY